MQNAGLSENNTIWHTHDITDLFGKLASGENGLSHEKAGELLASHGPNEITQGHRVTALETLVAQFKNLLIIILLVSTAISAALGHGIEAIAIAVIVLFAVLLGFIQEYRAERALESLREMAAPVATVLRDGLPVTVPSRDIVPGDILILSAGDRIAADSRLVEAVNLKTDESVLTGESLPVSKHTIALADSKLALADRNNMVYGGTIVTYGRGKALVTCTGMETEFGKIAGLLDTIKTEKTPLQENLDRVGATLAKAAFAGVALIGLMGVLRGQPVMEMFIFAIALGVAVVPEALPAVVTISLAIGVQRMIKRHALIRRLPAVETLGCTTYICSDKTGTLTKNEMTVRSLYMAGMNVGVTGTGYQPDGDFMSGGKQVDRVRLIPLLTAMCLCSDAIVRKHDDSWQVFGDPTEGALVTAAMKADLSREVLEKEYPRIGEIPFSSETRRMTTLHRSGTGTLSFSKGALEVILDSCSHVLSDGKPVPIDDSLREDFQLQARQMSEKALRVLAVAQRIDPPGNETDSLMTLLGIAGMMDPPRPEAKAAIAECFEAGITPVMITGDHPVTAGAVAGELGLLRAGKPVTGNELDDMDEKSFADKVESIEVYARVSPSHKMRIVQALKNKGHVVAMTGDGVNDAPALKLSDIGISMGITGTEVTKEASDMMLTDDNFASIVAAVEEGRGIFENIKKYLMYLLSSNIGEIGLMTVATIAGLPLPLTAVQILYVNLATDGLPALALAVDPPDKDIMHRPPRKAAHGIFTRPVVFLMVLGGVWSTLANIMLFVLARASGRPDMEAMTMTFVSLVLIQFFKAYNFRSDTRSITGKPFANKWLNRAVIWELCMLSVVVYLPVMHVPFSTYALTLKDMIIILLVSSSVTVVLEIGKWMVRRGWFKE